MHVHEYQEAKIIEDLLGGWLSQENVSTLITWFIYFFLVSS